MSIPPPDRFVARAERLRQRYGKQTALAEVSLDIPAGAMAGVIGPDGVGKSTLLSILAGVRKIQAGDAWVLGGRMKEARHRLSACPRIAFMPQGLGKNLYMTLSVFDNVDFFARLFGQERAERARRIGELLRATGLAAFKDRPAGQLSGGMKQKLGLCCALVHEPDLLILDEPTTGIDPLSRRQFWELIARMRRRRPGMSVIVSTAYMDEAEGFDWLAAMDEGRVLAQGSPQEVMARAQARTLDEAFIRLGSHERRQEHRALVVAPRASGGDETPAIVAEGLTRRFGDFTAVDRVSFEIRRGEIYGFIGSNGCGKTTTMRMLTGLLPATEGRAAIFGQSAAAGGLEVRKRVGVMSQSFSLYTELTVRQNLELHARLFHIPADKMASRIQSMATRFGLDGYMEALAEKLPLGTRQRLSLAVAMIHHPDMLILDEPTSGVDPAARERFWGLLVELSRRDRVTIFVSTHFMNEAAWCDRISLMHAGKVLAEGVPAELVRRRGASSLEEAFISYLQEAAGSAHEEPESELPSAPAQATAPAPVLPWRAALRRVLAYAQRESADLARDPIRMIFALLGSAVLMLVLGYGISMDVEDVPFAVLDRDQTPESRDYAQNLDGSRYFTALSPLADDAEMERRFRSAELSFALEIPSGYGKALRRGQALTLGAWVDGAMPMRAQSIGGYAAGLHADYLARLAARSTRPPGAESALPVEPRYRYNQDFKSLYAMAPAAMPILLILVPSMIMALGVVREKELGSIVNFYATPVTRLEFLIGKQIPYIAVSLLNFLLLVAMIVYLFGVPFKGSFGALSLGALLYIMCSTGLGFFWSTFTKTQIAAIFATMVANILPATLFSGMITPVSSMEGLGAAIGRVYPTTYFMIISRGAFTKALGFAELQGSFWALAAIIPVVMLACYCLLKKQDA